MSKITLTDFEMSLSLVSDKTYKRENKLAMIGSYNDDSNLFVESILEFSNLFVEDNKYHRTKF